MMKLFSRAYRLRRGVQFISICHVKLVELPAFSPFSGCVFCFGGNFELTKFFSCFCLVKKNYVMKVFVYVYMSISLSFDKYI